MVKASLAVIAGRTSKLTMILTFSVHPAKTHRPLALEVCKRGPPYSPFALMGAALHWGAHSFEVQRVMGKSARYRQYAAECRSIAESMRSGEQRSQLLDVAAEWEILAHEAERRSSHQPYDDNSWRRVGAI